MKKNREYIYLGVIVNTFGIKGELKLFTESDFIEERFAKGKKNCRTFGYRSWWVSSWKFPRWLE